MNENVLINFYGFVDSTNNVLQACFTAYDDKKAVEFFTKNIERSIKDILNNANLNDELVNRFIDTKLIKLCNVNIFDFTTTQDTNFLSVISKNDIEKIVSYLKNGD
ncbi:hypothetical protein [Capybara microvirus Cap3_SP_613]|nr:hypothetical protein [Capybara microvirus Cap3_SP_613]